MSRSSKERRQQKRDALRVARRLLDEGLSGPLKVRVSDNVLDPSDWGYWNLQIVRGRVRSVIEGARSCYTDPLELLGKTLEEVAAWTRYDGTGTHPQYYCEVLLPSGNKIARWQLSTGLGTDVGRPIMLDVYPELKAWPK